MKSKEEIEQLAKKSNAERGIDSAKSMLEREYVLGYTTAYTQSQKDNEAEENRLKKIMIESSHQSMSLAEEKARNSNKKYTEEDMLKCWNTAFTDAMNIDSETYKPIFYSDFINSLNKQD